MEYYHELVTQKSWQELQNLRRLADFVLIGGWAVYLYTQALKSKDIDIIVDYAQLPRLSKNYALVKNDRLKKYEAVREEVQIDIYLPHYSHLGLPVEDLARHTQKQEGFILLSPDYLAALKIYTLAQRSRSPKGQKDLWDVVSLFAFEKADLEEVKKIIDQYQLEKEAEKFKEILAEHTHSTELGFNPHFFAKMKRIVLQTL